MSLLDKWRENTANQAIPLQASLELTYRCNERCTHCYIEKFWDDPKKVLALNDWEKILDELKSAGTLYLFIMGGEAMLNPLFWDILTAAQKRHFHLSMITNGLKIQTIEIAERLKNLGVKNVSISLYSIYPEIHDAMTQVKGSHQKTLNAISLLRSAQIKVGINCLLTKNNIDDYMKLALWCLQENLEMKVDPTVTAKLDGDLAPTAYRANKEQLTRHYEQVATTWPRGVPRPIYEKGADYVCNAAKGKCAVNPYGDLLSCIEIRKPLGNLVKQSFTEAWNSEEANKWRNIRNQDLKGVDQKTKAFCEHCPGMALNEINDPLKILDHSQMVAETKKEVYDKYAHQIPQD